nr:hypothetical protein CFP56_37160 [Quercus suber]
MLRSAAAPRSLLRSLTTTTTTTTALKPAPLSSQCRSAASLARRPHIAAATKVWGSLLQARRGYAMDNIDKDREAKIGEKKLPVQPNLVSGASSTHPIMTEIGQKNEEKKAQKVNEEGETEMMAGVKHDMRTIRETFSLAEVPREAYYMGMAGVIPYGVTSLSTVYCAWEIHQAAESGTGYLMSEKSAEALLHIIEPLQVGYGAVIISFLGAIHWGLEWAAYGGTKGYPRYMIGVTSTAMAWPTILLPVEYALISQFLVFNFLYYNDSRATKRGWAPPWYAVYRFVLTFIVGASIVVSLIGRGEHPSPSLPSISALDCYRTPCISPLSSSVICITRGSCALLGSVSVQLAIKAEGREE